MSTRRKAQTYRQRFNALKAGKDRKDMVPAPLIIPYSATTSAWLDAFFGPYKIKIDAVDAALIAQGAATNLVKTTRRKAELNILHFYTAMQNAIVREVFPVEIRAGYGLALTDNKIPIINSEAAISFWGNKILVGEAARIAGGGAPISFPSLANVTTALTNFETANLLQSNAKDAYDISLEAVEADNAECDKLILKMWNETETTFDEGNKPSMRRKCREWGVVYVPIPGEALNPDEYSIAGKVTDSATGANLGEVVITMVEPDVTVLSESNGNYYLGHQPAGSYTIQIHKAGYLDKTIPGVIVATGAVTTLNMTMASIGATGILSGTVTAPGFPPATVTVAGTALTATTDAMGNFTITGVPAGVQTVQAFINSNPINIQTQTPTVVPGATTTVSFSFP